MNLIFGNLKILFTSCKKMPFFFMYLYGLVAVTFIPFLFFGFWPWPNAEYELNGKTLNYSEFWLTGLAPIFLIFTFIMSYVCLSCAKGKAWSRWGIFLFYASIIALFSYGSITGAIIGSGIVALLWYYFYSSNKLNMYYQKVGEKNT